MQQDIDKSPNIGETRGKLSTRDQRYSYILKLLTNKLFFVSGKLVSRVAVVKKRKNGAKKDQKKIKTKWKQIMEHVMNDVCAEKIKKKGAKKEENETSYSR